ncbi:MAG: trigger factor [bacterium]|nr:trigger factor [bacterium]
MKHKYTVKNLPKSVRQITITHIDEEALKKAENRVLAELSQELNLKGFRPGKVPESVVREHIRPEHISTRRVELAIPGVLQEIAVEEKLRALSQPNVDFKSFDPLEIIIAFDVYPELKLGGYQKIKVKREQKKASEKEVGQALEELQERFTEFKEVKRAAKKGDKVEIDFEGFTPDGVALENTASKNHPVILGSGSLIPGFEEEVVEMKPDDQKEFDITFPKDYHAKSMAGKKTKFKVKLNLVHEPEKPKLDDAFAKKVTKDEKKGLEDLKKELRDDIQKQHDAEVDRKQEDEYFQKLAEITEVEIPESLLAQEKEAILRELKQRILYQGLSFDKYLQASGKTEEELLTSYDKQAEERIKLQMALGKIAEMEKIDVSDIELEEHLNGQLERYPENQRAQIKKQYSEGSQAHLMLEHQVRMKKTLEKIIPKE